MKKTYYSTVQSVESSVSGDKDVSIADASIVTNGTLYTGQGSTRRNPIDKHDEETAQLLALSRAFSSLSKELKKAANIRENDMLRKLKLVKPAKVRGGTKHPSLISKAATKPSKAPLKGKPRSIKIKV